MLAHFGGAGLRVRSPTSRRTSRRWRRLAAAAAVLMSTLTVGFEPAAADNYPPANGTTGNCSLNSPGGVNRTDPNPLTFYHSALEPAVNSAVEWARTERYEKTSISTSLLTSSGSTTDVVSFDQDYTVYCGYTWHNPTTTSPGVVTIGLSTCVSIATDGLRCERHENRYDTSYMFADGITQDHRNIVACHETGHAWGFSHRTAENGCMYHPMPHAGELTVHDTKHINGGPWIMPNELPGYRTINNGERMVSWDGRYLAIMQTDGNFVVYGPPGGPCDSTGVCWHTGTNWAGSGTWAVMQSDGNFVIYHSSAFGITTLCNSGTFYGSGTTLEMQNDGNLVIYRPGHLSVRSSEGSVGGLCL